MNTASKLAELKSNTNIISTNNIGTENKPLTLKGPLPMTVEKQQNAENANLQLSNPQLSNPHQCFEEVKKLLTEAVREGVFPGAVVYAGHKGRLIYQGAFGQRSLKMPSNPSVEPAPMQIDSVFDIGGLTSIIASISLTMMLVEQGRIRLEDRVSRHIPGFGVNGKSPITIQNLLTHTSGFPAQHNFHEEIAMAYPSAKLGMYASKSAKDFIANSIARFPLKGEIGGKPVVSDLNFLVLGLLIESVLGIPLDKATDKYVIQPLRLRTSSFINLALLKHANLQPVTEIIAPTEDCPWRQKLIWGEVQDDNAWTMGGVAGHAGLFSTGSDVFSFSCELLTACSRRGTLFSKEILNTFIKHESDNKYNNLGGHKLGFDSPSKENGMIDSGLSSQAFGMNGFTGCSMWVDPASDINIVMMTNRVHPSRNNKKINLLRPILVKTVVDAVKRVVGI